MLRQYADHDRAKCNIAAAVLALATFIDTGAPSGAADPEHTSIQVNVFPLETLNLGGPETNESQCHGYAGLSLALQHCKRTCHFHNSVVRCCLWCTGRNQYLGEMDWIGGGVSQGSRMAENPRHQGSNVTYRIQSHSLLCKLS